MLLLLNTVCSSESRYVSRINEGLVIQELSDNICLQTSTANLHFILKLPTIDANSSVERDFDCGSITNGTRANMHGCRVIRPLLNSLHHLQKSMTITTKTELIRILDMLTAFEHQDKNTTKRGFLTSIGSWVGGTFGLATMDHIADIKTTLRQLYDITYNSAQTLDASGKTMSKIVVTQNKRMDILHSLIQQETNISRSLFREFNRFGINFDITSQIVGQSIRHISQYIENLEHINSISYGLHQLITGQLTDELVSRELLHQELIMLQSQLGTATSICHTDSGFYYSANTAKAFRTADSLIISVSVPLSHYRERFAAIRVIPTPLPMHTEGNSYMLLKIDKDMIIYSLSAAVWIELDKPPTETGIILLEQQPIQIIRPDTPTSCIQAIILRRGEWMAAHCQFQYFHSSQPPPRIIRIETNKVILIGVSEAKLACNGQEPQKITINQITAVMKVDCNCDITTKSLFLPSVLAHCALGAPRLPKIVYGYNKLLLQSLFDDSQMSDVSDIQYHDNPLEIEIPDVHIEEGMRQDSMQSVKLNELTNNIVNRSKLYGDVSSYIYHKVVDNMLASTAERTEFSVFSYSSWLTCISFGLATIACFYSVYLTMKLRAVAILIVAGSHAVKAQEIQSDVLIRTLRLTPRPINTPRPAIMADSAPTNWTYRTLVNITDEHVSNGLILVLIYLTHDLQIALFQLDYETDALIFDSDLHCCDDAV